MKKKERARQVLFVIIVLVLVLIIFFLHRAYGEVSVLKDHRDYLTKGGGPIQPWMTVQTVERHFNLTEEVIIQELNATKSMSVRRMTIEDICKRNRLDCPVVIARLNGLVD